MCAAEVSTSGSSRGGRSAAPLVSEKVLEREREVRRLADEFVETAVEVSLVQVRQVDIAQRLLEHQGVIAGSVANWLSQRAGLSGSEAKQLCRVARRLPDLPLIDAAFRAGRLSLDTTDVLVKVATPANESVVLQTAGAATGAQLRKIIATFRRIRAHDEPEPTREEHAWHGDDETMWSLRARLQPGRGGEVEAALRAAREDLWSSSRTSQPGQPGAEPGAEHGDGARPQVSTADALVHMARAYLEPKVTAAGQLPERFLTIVHVDLTAAGADHDHPRPNREQRRRAQRPSRRRRGNREKRGSHARDGRGRADAELDLAALDRDGIASIRGMGPIDGPTLGQLLCDSLISVVDHRGVDVTATAPVRLATPAQRQALHALHPTCQYPGCGRTRYLQAHHVTAHPHGPTALGNLVLLCDEHHAQIHTPGWTIELAEDRTLIVRDPRGNELRRGALRPAPEIAKTANELRAASGAEKKDPVDVSRRLHGTGDRLDAWTLDNCLHFWLEATAA
jgi:hypothetical protein